MVPLNVLIYKNVLILDMDDIAKKKKQPRDWVNAWTILVLPALAISILSLLLRVLFSHIEKVYDIVKGVGIFGNGAIFVQQTWLFFLIICFLVLPPFCLLWGLVHYFFVKNPRKKNGSLRRIQIAFNIVFSLLCLVVAIIVLGEVFRPHPIYDEATLSPEFIEAITSDSVTDSPNR